jgi:hypothetical protein
MGIRYAALFAAALAALASCEKPVMAPIGAVIDGPYRLTSGFPGADPGEAVCYRKLGGGCDLRIGPAVVQLGWDEDFIAAAVRKPGEPEAVDYYYIVRDFDGPRADVKRVVRGPFDEKKFIEERRKHGVPGVAPLTASAD